MGDYDFSGLNTRSFEQMIQSLCIGVLGPGVVIFGDGPDGGREATYEGSLKQMCPDDPDTTGYLVVQAKFCQRPHGKLKEDTEWLRIQLKQEMSMFAKGKRRKPDFYIIATNLILSPVQDTGGKDKISRLFESYSKKVPLQQFWIWDYDQLCRFLDTQEGIRHAYAAWITPGDVLTKIVSRLKFDKPDFNELMTNFLQKELLQDQYSKLEQAGYSPENRIPLEKVFVDLPTFDDKSLKPPEEKPPLPAGFLAHILDAASIMLGTIRGEPKRQSCL
jgi:hypothetical protein